MTVGRAERYDDVILLVESLELMGIAGILIREGSNLAGPQGISSL